MHVTRSCKCTQHATCSVQEAPSEFSAVSQRWLLAPRQAHKEHPMSPEEQRRRHPCACAESKSPCRPWSAPEQKLQLRGLAELQTLQTLDLRGIGRCKPSFGEPSDHERHLSCHETRRPKTSCLSAVSCQRTGFATGLRDCPGAPARPPSRGFRGWD